MGGKVLKLMGCPEVMLAANPYWTDFATDFGAAAVFSFILFGVPGWVHSRIESQITRQYSISNLPVHRVFRCSRVCVLLSFIFYVPLGIAALAACLTSKDILGASFFGGLACTFCVVGWISLYEARKLRISIGKSELRVEGGRKTKVFSARQIGSVRTGMLCTVIGDAEDETKVLAWIPLLLDDAPCALAMLRRLSGHSER